MSSQSPIIVPNNEKRVLLHVCCAPCSGSVIEDIKKAGTELTLFFYNPNIYPKEEYDIRKNEVMRYAKELDIPFIDADYDSGRFFELTTGHENEPERSKRCDICFEMRLMMAAQYAHTNGFRVFTTTLGISRWKDFDQVTRAGQAAASLYPELIYWAHNWRKNDGVKRMHEISEKEDFYKQQYCGCKFSLRDHNLKEIEKDTTP